MIAAKNSNNKQEINKYFSKIQKKTQQKTKKLKQKKTKKLKKLCSR